MQSIGMRMDIGVYLPISNTHIHICTQCLRKVKIGERRNKGSQKKKKKILSHFIVQTSRIQQQQEQHNYEYKSLY